jgi:cobalt/nickel transport system ATP-binding protein
VSEDAITVSGLSYTYPDGRRAIDRVSFRLGAGESIGLIGPNGAGKTTLFHLIAGLLPPGEGSIRIFGKTFDGKDDARVRRHLGFVFQETEDQLFSPTVFDDVAFGPLNFGQPLEGVRRQVAEALRQVGLEGFEERVPHHLSSGERRRVAIATVLSYRPDVLILDEPSSDLDPRGRRELVKLLRATSQARIIASHDLEFILRTCERVLVIDGGRLQAEGPTAEVLCNGSLLEAHGLLAPLGLRHLEPGELLALLDGEEERG